MSRDPNKIGYSNPRRVEQSSSQHQEVSPPVASSSSSFRKIPHQVTEVRQGPRLSSSHSRPLERSEYGNNPNDIGTSFRNYEDHIYEAIDGDIFDSFEQELRSGDGQGSARRDKKPYRIKVYHKHQKDPTIIFTNSAYAPSSIHDCSDQESESSQVEEEASCEYIGRNGRQIALLTSQGKAYVKLAKIEKGLKRYEEAYRLYLLATKKFAECISLSENESQREKFRAVADACFKQATQLGVYTTPESTTFQSDLSTHNKNRSQESTKGACDQSNQMFDKEAAVRAHFTEILNANISPTDWSQIVGYSKVKKEIHRTLILPRILQSQGIVVQQDSDFSNCVLMFGPPGTGKTMIGKALATALRVKFFSIKNSDILDQYQGNGPAKMRIAFDMAKQNAPCLLFVDEMESMLSAMYRGKDAGTILIEFLAQFNDVMDFNHEMLKNKINNKEVFLCGATNRPDLVDGAVWRRFGKYIHVPLPTDEDKKEILISALGELVCGRLSEQHWNCVMEATEGFSNSDLIELARDVKSAPLRKCEEASCFKWYCGPNPNNPTEIVEGWTPCSLHDQEKYKMSMMDIIDRGEKMVPPAISLRDVLLSASCRPQTVDPKDMKGLVQQCEQFAKQYAQNLECTFSLEEDENFDFYGFQKLEIEKKAVDTTNGKVIINRNPQPLYFEVDDDGDEDNFFCFCFKLCGSLCSTTTT